MAGKLSLAHLVPKSLQPLFPHPIPECAMLAWSLCPRQPACCYLGSAGSRSSPESSGSSLAALLEAQGELARCMAFLFFLFHQTGRKTSSICWFTLQVCTGTGAGPGTEIVSGSLTAVSGTQPPELSPTVLGIKARTQTEALHKGGSDILATTLNAHSTWYVLVCCHLRHFAIVAC